MNNHEDIDTASKPKLKYSISTLLKLNNQSLPVARSFRRAAIYTGIWKPKLMDFTQNSSGYVKSKYCHPHRLRFEPGASLVTNTHRNPHTISAYYKFKTEQLAFFSLRLCVSAVIILRIVIYARALSLILTSIILGGQSSLHCPPVAPNVNIKKRSLKDMHQSQHHPHSRTRGSARCFLFHLQTFYL